MQTINLTNLNQNYQPMTPVFMDSAFLENLQAQGMSVNKGMLPGYEAELNGYVGQPEKRQSPARSPSASDRSRSPASESDKSRSPSRSPSKSPAQIKKEKEQKKKEKKAKEDKRKREQKELEKQMK
jgi:ATPase subunit of ABC transporter with duplicated ATPase domains